MIRGVGGVGDVGSIQGPGNFPGLSVQELTIPKQLSQAATPEEMKGNIEKLSSHTSHHSVAGKTLAGASEFIDKYGIGATVGGAIGEIVGGPLVGLAGALIGTAGQKLVSFVMSKIAHEL